jgi:hypothetical protein
MSNRLTFNPASSDRQRLTRVIAKCVVLLIAALAFGRPSVAVGEPADLPGTGGTGGKGGGGGTAGSAAAGKGGSSTAGGTSADGGSVGGPEVSTETEMTRNLVLAMTKRFVADAEALSGACNGKSPPASCQKYCPKDDAGHHTLGLCALTDRLLAASAALTDGVGVAAAFKSALPPTAGVLDSPPQSGAQSLSIPGVASDFAAVALQGLAKLVADRAKQEAIAWFLDRLGQSLCQDAEIATYWLPAVCTLADEEHRLGRYGAGAAVLDALRQSVLADARGWPGSAAGLGVGALFLADASEIERADPKQPREKNSDPTHCDASKERDLCGALARIRSATGTHVTALLDGDQALTVLAALGRDYHAANQKQGGGLFSRGLEASACALGFPLAFTGYEQAATLLGPLREQAAGLAALVSVPGCETLTVTVSAQPPTSESTALDHIAAYIRLSEPIRQGHDFAASYRKLSDALAEYTAAIKAAQGALSPLSSLPPPKFDGASPEAMAEGIDAYFTNLGRALGNQAYKRVVVAVLGVADATAALGSSGVGVLRATTESNPVAPGLCEGKCDKKDIFAAFEQADKNLASLKRALADIRKVVNGEWSHVLPTVLTRFTQRGGLSAHAEAGVTATRKKLARHADALLALLQAKDGDAAARALDSIADPPGGWRTKSRAGTKTFAVVAHPGIYTALEWRYGQYGASLERGKPGYVQAPSPAMPVGLELAFGCGNASHGLFFPLLDPLAFLQYDASKDARLPGASFKTALSPGVGYRVSIGHSPFNVMPLLVYRPAFRAWKSELDARGADALQLGILFSVDVTLYGSTNGDDDQ